MIKKKWYLIKTFLGFEKKIIKIIFKKNIISKKENKKIKIYPGYILIKLIIDDINFNLIKNINNVIGFLCIGKKKPLSINNIKFNNIKNIFNKKKNIKKFKIGKSVYIIKGPFLGFKGIIKKVDFLNKKIKLSLYFFNRFILVKLNFNQINDKKIKRKYE